jgi:hypothetical protein
MNVIAKKFITYVSLRKVGFPLRNNHVPGEEFKLSQGAT